MNNTRYHSGFSERTNRPGSAPQLEGCKTQAHGRNTFGSLSPCDCPIQVPDELINISGRLTMEFIIENEVELPDQLFDARYHPDCTKDLIAAVSIAGNVHL